MEYTDVVLIAVIVGLVELLKWLGAPKKVLPVAALALGLLGGLFYIYPGDIKAGILIGIIMGLSASGLYSGTKNIIEKE